MAYIYKELKNGDYTRTPYGVYKEWEFTEASVGVDIMVYKGHLGNTSEYAAVTRSNQYPATKDSVFRQIRHLYYGGNPQTTGSMGQNPFVTGSGWRINQPIGTFGGNKDKEIRTLEDTTINWISISQPIYGDGIKKGSVELVDRENGVTLLDDGIGNLYDRVVYDTLKAAGNNITGSYVGNIFYEHGNIVITTGSSYENTAVDGYTPGVSEDGGFNLTFKSTHTIYEHSVFCIAEEGEFNFSMNESLIQTGSDGKLDGDRLLSGYATSSTFRPYVTTIGLYDDFNRLVAIGKLPRAIANDPNLAIAFEVRIDT